MNTDEWSDFQLALDILQRYVVSEQMYTRKGSRKGGQEPLSDNAQYDDWIKARNLLVKHKRPVPVSGTLDDG